MITMINKVVRKQSGKKVQASSKPNIQGCDCNYRNNYYGDLACK